MSINVIYNSKTIASVQGGQKATLDCKGKLMESDVIVDALDVSGGEAVAEYDGTVNITGGASNDVEVKPANIQPLTITENGVYTASGDIDGYSPVTIEVPIPEGYIKPSGDFDITENGTYDITQYANVNVNVESSGGSGSDEEWIGDGKTHLWIKIAAEGRMDVPLCFAQTVSNGVTIDWGDGSAPQTVPGLNPLNNIFHTYASIGEYIITLDVAEGCALELGHRDYSSYCVMGSTTNHVYCNMLQKVEIGNGAISIGKYAFQHCTSLANIKMTESITSISEKAFYLCYSLPSIIIPESITSIGEKAFHLCYALASIIILENVTSIGKSAFHGCQSFASIIIPKSVTSIGDGAFANCTSIKFYDFTEHTSVPTLYNSGAIQVPSDCEIRVPAALYDEWIAATNWSTHASKIVAV